MESLLLASALLAGVPEAAVTPYDVVVARDRLLGPLYQAEDFANPARDAAALVRAAAAAGLLNESEALYRSLYPHVLQDALDEWRAQLRELRDCPEEWEGLWLPETGHCMEMLGFHAKWEAWVSEYVYWHADRADWAAVMLGEGAARLRLWRALDWCRYAGGSSYMRRVKMREVRALIGREAWDRRELPFVAPEWAFTEGR